MSSTRHRVRVCEAKGCSNTSKNGNKSLYLFPTDPERRCQWIENLEVSSTSTRKVKFACSDHFGMDSFVDTLKRRIHRTAVPEPLSKKYNLDDENSRIVDETTTCKAESLSFEIDPDIDDPDESIPEKSSSDDKLRMIAAAKTIDEPGNVCVTIKTEPDTEDPELEKSTLYDDCFTMVAARKPTEIECVSIKTEPDTDDPYTEKSSLCGTSLTIAATKKPNKNVCNFLKNEPGIENSAVVDPGDATSKKSKSSKRSTIPCYRMVSAKKPNKDNFLKSDLDIENSDEDDPGDLTSKKPRSADKCYEKPRHRTRFCDAKGCTSSSKNSDKSLFLFPTDPERKAVWMKNLEASSSRKVKFACSDHFDMDSFVDSFRRRLHRIAVPVPLSQTPNLDVKVPRALEETEPSQNECIFFEIDPEIDNLDDSSLEQSSSDDETSRIVSGSMPAEHERIPLKTETDTDDPDDPSIGTSDSGDKCLRLRSAAKTNNPSSRKRSSQNVTSTENNPPHKKICINDKCLVHHPVT